VPDAFLDPRATWAVPVAYDAKAAKLKRMFEENYAFYEEGADPTLAGGAAAG
jgi:phosphoenolpyruvate carboxykinase (ATP)